jgi:hypothetical protein
MTKEFEPNDFAGIAEEIIEKIKKQHSHQHSG